MGLYHEGKVHRVRLVYNPQGGPVQLPGSFTFSFKYGIFPENSLPEELKDEIFAFLPSKGVFYSTGSINGQYLFYSLENFSL